MKKSGSPLIKAQISKTPVVNSNKQKNRNNSDLSVITGKED